MDPYFRARVHLDQFLQDDLPRGDPVSLAQKVATLLLPTVAGALAAWGLAFAAVEVGATPPRILTLAGHLVVASYGGIIGVLIGYVTIRLNERVIASRYRLHLSVLATVFAGLVAAGMLFPISESVFYLIPDSVMDCFMPDVAP